MSSALNSVLGPVGQLASKALDIASMVYPPLAIANSISNLALGALGGALNGAMDALKQQGMPGFLGDIVKDAIGSVLPGLMTGGLEEVTEMIQDKAGDKFEAFQNDFMKDFLDTFNQYKSDEDKKGGGVEGGKGGGKSWFVAMMEALGEMQNKQAEKLEKLQGEVSESLTGSDASKEDKKAEFNKMEEFKAEAKLQEALAGVAKTIGDAVGNALNAVARPQ